ncbi:RHS repeat-associated core domain-containing protein [Streptomyces gilvus]|uniref:RHS repeat-associated core domain-containing protein n=1 Tax=Streptomyces gilvus TaxID=2920937 RepID=UPI001F1092BD|nr:RHS repeat-associated core domain-containing protein [Streptomyces sp. CME 23]MCH5675084.1 hypothetical protein [Streptomyces sp. CME 23]
MPLHQRRPGQPRDHGGRRQHRPHRHLGHQQRPAPARHQRRRQRQADRRQLHRPARTAPGRTHTSSGTDYDHLDGNGSVTDVTDAGGTSLVHYTCDPFGTQTATPVDGQTAPADTFGYTGWLNDSILTGKLDLRARTHDPATGRFTSTDPITLRVTDPYVSTYVYSDDAPTYETDPSGESEAPGRGWWVGGSTYQHNFALEMAYEQEVARCGANNVYADISVARTVTGGHGLTVPTYWNDEAKPDLIAFGVQTPRGTGYAVWDVKPASAYGRSIKNSVDKLTGYIHGFSKMTGYPVVAGGPRGP